MTEFEMKTKSLVKALVSFLGKRTGAMNTAECQSLDFTVPNFSFGGNVLIRQLPLGPTDQSSALRARLTFSKVKALIEWLENGEAPKPDLVKKNRGTQSNE